MYIQAHIRNAFTHLQTAWSSCPFLSLPPPQLQRLVWNSYSMSQSCIMTRKQADVIQFNVAQTVRVAPLRFNMKLKYVLTL